MAFLLETHMHTSEGSACGKLSAEQQVEQYKKAGYDGIIVTDHFVTGNSAVNRDLPWVDQMHQQFQGVSNAKEAGDKAGLKVFCGIEFGYYGTEWIVIGLDEKWYMNHPEIVSMDPPEFLKLFREEGAAVIHAHPYREATYIHETRLYPEYVDAIEVYNYTNMDEWNNKAIAHALANNKPMTAGSDCHKESGYGAGILLDKAPSSEADLIRIIKSGKGWSLYTPYKELYI